jgi:hypothetical protein
MSTPSKLGILIFSLFILYVIYLLTAEEGIGSFEKIRSGGEINQNIKVVVNRSAGFERDQNGNIISFYATDKNGAQAKISPQEPVSGDIAGAEIVELFGHMHGNNFIAVQVSIVEIAKD